MSRVKEADVYVSNHFKYSPTSNSVDINTVTCAIPPGPIIDNPKKLSPILAKHNPTGFLHVFLAPAENKLTQPTIPLASPPHRPSSVVQATAKSLGILV